MPNKRIEILGWVADEEESRSAASEQQNQKLPPQHARTAMYPVSNLNMGISSADKVWISSSIYVMCCLQEFRPLPDQGKMDSNSRQMLTGMDKPHHDLSSVAPNAYPPTKMSQPSADHNRKSVENVSFLDESVRFLLLYETDFMNFFSLCRLR